MNQKRRQKDLPQDNSAEISANNSLVFYTNEKNIPNQELVKKIIEYFENGPGSRAFQPLLILNILWKQYCFINEHIEQPGKVFKHLINLPLDEVQKHILFGLIIKWFGGYPLEAPLGIGNTQLYYNLRKQILDVFLSYPGDTPEKEFCKADMQKRKRMMKLGIALTAAINGNMDVKQIFDALEDENQVVKQYLSFDSLFEDAAQNGSVGEFLNQQSYLIARSRYNFEFNLWLHDLKGWEYNNDESYKTFLTKNYWIEFLSYQRQIEIEREKLNAIERNSWRVQPQQTDDINGVIKKLIEKTELHNFLSVPAPDVLHKDAFWQDEKNEPIHCNIYHPKYGHYPGFESYTKDVVVTSFNPVSIYQDPRSGKYVYCRYDWQILCTADNIHFTNKDGEKVVKVDWIEHHQTRLADSDADFHTIYLREFDSKGLKNTPETQGIFKEQLIKHIQKLIKQHEEKSDYKEGLDIEVLALASRLVNYLNTGIKKSVAKIEGPVCALFCSIVDESRVFPMGDESKSNYCQRVIDEFHLPANAQQARKRFNRLMDVRPKDQTLRSVREIILPLLPNETRNTIEQFIERKLTLSS